MALSIELQETWKKAALPQSCTLQEAIQLIDKTSLRIAILTNESNKVVATITDGDIRRALLSGFNLSSPGIAIGQKEPLLCHINDHESKILSTLLDNAIDHVPLIDDADRLAGLARIASVPRHPLSDSTMVIMAGGLGTRMGKHTKDCPKPMLPVNGKPILEHIILRAKRQGLFHFSISLNYLGETIAEYFGNGSNFGVSIDYINETTPLGTAGALSNFAPASDKPFFVVNGDVLNSIDLAALHKTQKMVDAVATVAIRTFDMQIPYGRVELENDLVCSIEEKPVISTNINAGVYLLSPEIMP